MVCLALWEEFLSCTPREERLPVEASRWEEYETCEDWSLTTIENAMDAMCATPTTTTTTKPQIQKRKRAKAEEGCNCKRSKCLKGYCECFQAGRPCGVGCMCENCENTTESQPRLRKPKKLHKGCTCKRSKCLKGYCECFQAGEKCGVNGKRCMCKGCHNQPPDDSPIDERTQPTQPPPPNTVRTVLSF